MLDKGVFAVKKKGFSPIELLIVIAIVVILGVFLFPIFARARIRAREANCRGNLQSMTQAVKAYAYDQSGYQLPAFARDAKPAGVIKPLEPALQENPARHLTNYECASASFSPSYAANGLLTVENFGLIEYPYQTVLIWDARESMAEAQYDQRSFCDSIDYRHGDRANLAMADGSVKTVNSITIKQELESGSLIFKPQFRLAPPSSKIEDPQLQETPEPQLIEDQHYRIEKGEDGTITLIPVE